LGANGTNALDVSPKLGQDSRGQPFLLTEEPQEQMLGANGMSAIHTSRFFVRRIQHSLDDWADPHLLS
jgi:hypothetical protein